MQATATTLDHEQEYTPINSRNKVLVASLIGTAIEFFDFYIYATAAVIVFPHIFFPQGDPTAATLQSLATFAIAFVARPIGSAVFGHFGDRVGRKATLVASLLTMGISTVVIGLLPGYATIGIFAPLLLALARFGQGLGLGGEWGGAALLATENAPPRKRALYGSFPQLGAPIGFFFANGTFLLLSLLLTAGQFLRILIDLVIQTNSVQKFLCHLVSFGSCFLFQQCRCQSDIFANSQVIKYVKVLEYHTHLLTMNIDINAFCRDIGTLKEDFSFSRSFQ